MIKFPTLLFQDVPAPQFGPGVTIRVNQRTIRTYARRAALGLRIDGMNLEPTDKTAHIIAANLMSVCTIPETGADAFADEQITDFVNGIDDALFVGLSMANSVVNADDFEKATDEPPKTLKQKKRKFSVTD